MNLQFTSPLQRLVRPALAHGLWAGLLSTAVLVWRGRAELARPAAPVNAPAHWLFGDESLRSSRPSWRHTATGMVVHQASAFMWAACYALLQARRSHPDPVGAVVDAVAVTSAAALVDLKLVPERLTPGFERRLSAPSVTAVYVAFAAGLVISALRR